LQLVLDDVAQTLAAHGEVRVLPPGFVFGELLGDTVGPAANPVRKRPVVIADTLGEGIANRDEPSDGTHPSTLAGWGRAPQRICAPVGEVLVNSGAGLSTDYSGATLKLSRNTLVGS
jgi:hypothetical protein